MAEKRDSKAQQAQLSHPQRENVITISFKGPHLLGAKNVVEWRREALAALQACGAMSYIVRPCLKQKKLVPVVHPAEPDDSYLNRMQMAIGAIKQTLSPAVSHALTEEQCIDPAELWQYLWDSNQPDVEQSLAQCIADMHSLNYDGSIEKPFQELKALTQRALRLCNNDAKQVLDAIAKYRLLALLPNDSHLKTFASITANSAKDLDAWVSAVSAEEARSSGDSGSSSSSVAMLAAGGNPHRQQQERSGSTSSAHRGARGGRNTARLPRCQLCDKAGHTAKQCNAPGAPNALAPGQHQPQHQQQHQRQHNTHAHVGETTVFADAGWPVPPEQQQQARSYYTVVLSAETSGALRACRREDDGDGFAAIDVVADSGAGHHMFAERSAFVSLQKLEQPVTIAFGQGSSVVATHGGRVLLLSIGARGSARVRAHVTLSKALYVPGLAANLLSLPALAQCGAQWCSNGAHELLIKARPADGGDTLINAHLGLGGVYRFSAGVLSKNQPKLYKGKLALAALDDYNSGSADGGAGEPAAQQQQQRQQRQQSPLPLSAEFVRPELGDCPQQQQQQQQRQQEQLPIEEPGEFEAFLAGLRPKAPFDGDEELPPPPLPLPLVCFLSVLEAALLWHCRYGHTSYQTLAALPEAADGVTATKAQFNTAAAAAATAPCVSCARGRLTALPHRPCERRATRPAELVHSDVLAFRTAAKGGGETYAVTLRDDATGFGFVTALRSKGEAAAALITMLKTLANLAGRPVGRLRTDNGSELLNTKTRDYCKQVGITVEPSAPYSPQSNGVAERYNRSLLEKARCLCAAANLGAEYWRYALYAAAALLNRQPPRGGGPTPYELLLGRRPDVSRLRAFGAKAYALVPGQLRGKLAATCVEGLLVGFVGDGAGGGYLIERPDGSTTVRRDVVFDEASVMLNTKPTALPAASQQQQQQQRRSQQHGGSFLLPAPRGSSGGAGSGGEWNLPIIKQPSTPPQTPRADDCGREWSAVAAQPQPAAEQQQRAAAAIGGSSGGSSGAATPRDSQTFVRQMMQQALPLPRASSNAAAQQQPQQQQQQAAGQARRDTHQQQQQATRTQPPRGYKGVRQPDGQAFNGTHVMEKHYARLEELQQLAAAADAHDDDNTPQERHAALLTLQQELMAAEQRGTTVALLATSCFLAPDPRNRKQAMATEEWPLWQAAESEEFESLVKRRVWTGPVPVPPGVKPLPCITVFKTKHNPDGTIERRKARVVVRGDLQPAATTVAWSPTAKGGVSRLHFAHAAKLGHQIHTIDISNAFLQGELDGDVYVLPPEGFPERCPPGTAFKLNRPLYGLRQSPRLWFLTLVRAMQQLNFERVHAEPAAFVRRQPSGDVEMISTHVDDLLLSALDVAPLKAELLARFDGRDLGPVHHHLSFIVEYDQPARTIQLHQQPMIEDLLATYNLDNARPLATPMQQNVKPAKDDGDALDAAGRKEYMSLLGSLLYLSVSSRPDIAYAVGVATRFAANPTDKHRLLLTHILRYLAGTTDLKLTYSPGGPEGIQAYTDADWATDTDTRRSVTGYVFNYYGGAITWASRRQSVVACSSTEAELIAACTGVKEALWLRQLCFEFGIDVCLGSGSAHSSGSSNAAANRGGARTLTLHVDNQSAIHLLRDPISSHRTKHIDVAFHFVHEHVDKQRVKFVFVPTAEQRADALTKPVGKKALQTFIDFCGLR